MKNIELYIGEQGKERLLEINDDFSINMNYTYEDLESPTSVKNNFSKTISIAGTKMNNKVFGEIWQNDHIITDNCFNPNKRVPFILFVESSLIDEGYIQLNRIVRDKSNITYECTLYGGLGDMFYVLDSKDDGEIRTLGDLIWGIKDSQGHVLDPEHEMDFVINKDFIRTNWEHLGKDGDTIHDFISFLPMYNGIPDNDLFDPEKVFVNASTSGIGNTIEDAHATAANGLWMAEVPAMDEWANRDLRSYLQRPAFRVKKFIEAICKPENNGGYDIVLDPTFFNKDNPYYEKAYITLPLISSSVYNSNGYDFYGYDLTMGLNYGKEAVMTEPIYFNKDIDYSGLGYEPFPFISLDVSLYFDCKQTTKTDILYNSGKVPYPYGVWLDQSTASRLKVTVKDKDTGRIVNESDWYYFTDEKGAEMFGQKGATNFIKGYYYNPDKTGRFVFTDGTNTKFNIKMPAFAATDKLTVEVTFQKQVYTDQGGPWHYDWDNLCVWSNDNWQVYYTMSWYSGRFGINISNLTVSNNMRNMTNAHINKQVLFHNETQPSIMDILLSYTKKFGLVYVKNKMGRVITIQTRNSFFNSGKDIDITEAVDYSKPFKIAPLLFDKRFYRFAQKEGTDFYSKMYKDQYGKEYGQKRVDTFYQFGNESSDADSKNLFVSVPDVQTNTNYNRTWSFNNGANASSALVFNQNAKITGLDSVNEAKEVDYDWSCLAHAADNSVWFNKIKGRDFTHLLSVAGKDNSAGELDYSLCFYNGNVNCGGYFYLTDDMPDMFLLNEKAGYYCAGSDSMNSGYVSKLNEFPHFSRWITTNKNVVYSFDWGKPVEVFCTDVSYTEDASLYSRFWERMLAEQYSLDCRKMTCYVDLRKINVSDLALGNFYWFDNAWWIMNKITDYNICADGTTLVEFIKVLNKTNYTSGQLLK